MNSHSSTIRSSTEPTIGTERPTERYASSIEKVREYLRARSNDDGTAAEPTPPSPLYDKSLLLNLVLEEYSSSRRESPDLTISQYVSRFRGLGSSIRQSMFRLLEVQQYLDCHPELLELVETFKWPASGDILHGFHVLEELGRGTLSRVYLCRQPGIGQRPVVLKVARSGDYEASIMGRLDHPNIVPVYSIASDPEQRATLICMPFRGRSTLQDLIDHSFADALPRRSHVISEAARLWSKPGDQRLQSDPGTTPGRAFSGSFVDGVLRLACQLAEALAHAHRQGILHGDLKPSNVLLTPRGAPLLIDFNLATDNRTDVGPLGGTLPYMSPEQLVAITSESPPSASPYDVNCEIFSFGVLLFQLLAGDVPFALDDEVDDPTAAARSLLDKQRTTSPRVRSANPCVNRRLEEVVLSTLAFDPGVRPQSMDELRVQLKKQLNPWNRSRRWILAHRFLTAIAVAVVAVSTILATTYLALRPPYDVRQFRRGMAFQQQHEYEAALRCFERAAKANPQFHEAIYQRARTNMVLGDLDAAMSGFGQLPVDYDDGARAACVGYCFNLKQQNSEAIACYERALKCGYETAGLHNNLGVCYLITRSRLGEAGRFPVADQHLRRAIELDEQSRVARNNYVRLSVARASYDLSYVPRSAAEHMEFLLSDAPAGSLPWMDAAILYSVLAEREHDSQWLDKGIRAMRDAVQKDCGPTAHELTTNLGYRAYRTHPEFDALVDLARNQASHEKQRATPMFIHPAPEPSPGNLAP